MLYILGFFLPSSKKVRYSLTSIYGINKKLTNKICSKLLFHNNLKIKELTAECILLLTQELDKHYLIGSKLKKSVFDNINCLIKINSYRGIRHSLGYPVRGQRTHTNSKTKKRFLIK
uniref:Ribosomal protein S13 n=1 Tax=Glaucocystis nostochinearum TaxID=38271 RepID=E9P6C8_9EUKA|nr:ribosomal protein S13 [Glaucocystis nostochinearum]ADW83112.1 ribosomal protein S13 [Glaucocystis nostochinearum]